MEGWRGPSSRPFCISVSRLQDIMSGCSLAEGWLALAEMRACEVYWNPMRNPWAMPVMIYSANCRSG